MGNFSFAIPEATAQALAFSGAVGGIAQSAVQAAAALANMLAVSSGVPQISAEAQKIIDRNKKQLAIQQAEKSGDSKRAAELRAEMAVARQEKTLKVAEATKAIKAVNKIAAVIAG